MKDFLNKFWPWNEINNLKFQIVQLKLENTSMKEDLKECNRKWKERDIHVRKMAGIIALKGGILALLLMCFSTSAQPVQRQLLTTNSIPYLSSIGATNNGGGNPLIGGSLSVPATLYLTNITANTTLAPFTLSGTLGCGFQLYCSCTGGSDRTLTFPNGCTGAGLGIPPVVTITNAKAAWFGVLCIPGVNTNVFWSPIY